MPTMPRSKGSLRELGRQVGQLGAADAGRAGVVAVVQVAELHVAGLRHEAVDDAVEGDVVIDALARPAP